MTCSKCGHLRSEHTGPGLMCRAIANPGRLECKCSSFGDPVAQDREETDSCERGTLGCCVHHTGDTECQTW